jgi:N-acetylmuramoyl-L-alanine amidase
MKSTIVLAAVLFLWAATPAPGRGATSGSPLLRGATFVVDPGHGTKYPDGSQLNVGAVGPGGVEEQKVALDVGEDLAALLRAAGAKVVLTRSHAHPYRIGTVLRLDNRARAALANKLGATAFLAIHADSSLAASSHGTSVFWLKPNSVAFANALRKRLASLNLGESEFKARDLAVTSEATVPAALVELGFVSNPHEEQLLATPAFQHQEAQVLYQAILDTFGTAPAHGAGSPGPGAIGGHAAPISGPGSPGPGAIGGHAAPISK